MALKNPTKSTQQCGPSFTKPLEDVSCLQGQEATLECCVQGFPAPEIRWEKGGIQLNNSRRLHTEKQGDKCRLHIKSCTRLETGVFKCIAFNKFGSASTTASVRFDVVPPKVGGTNSVQKASSLESDKKTEFQNNISKLKKVTKPNDGKTNGVPNSSSPHFKDFPLRKSPLTNSFRRKADMFQTPQVSSLKTIAVNGRNSLQNTEENQKTKSNIFHTKSEAHKKEKTASQVAERQIRGTSPSKRTITIEPLHQSKKDTKKSLPSATESPKASDHIESLRKENDSQRKSSRNNSPSDMKRSPRSATESPKTNGHIESLRKGNDSQRTISRNDSPSKIPPKSDKSGKTSGLSPRGSVRHRKQAPKFVLSPMNKVVKEGETVKFMCSSSGFPEPKVTWKRRGAEVPVSERVLCYQRDCMHILEIMDLSCDDAGDYTVTLVNEVGTVEAPALLEVRAKAATRVPPRIIRPLTHQSVSEGQSCSFSCEVSGMPTPTCRWSRDGKMLEAHPDFKETFDGQVATLTIREVFLDDEGTYTMTTKNSVGKIDTSCDLTVLKTVASEPENAPVFIKKLSNVEVNDGQPLTLTVEVSGTEPVEIIWVHNESIVKDSSDFCYISSEDKKLHSLFIEEIFPEDSGIYFCEAYNLFGEAVTACMVKVKVPPSSLGLSSEEGINKQSVEEAQKIESCELVEKVISSAKRKSDAEVEDLKNAFRRSIIKSKGIGPAVERRRSESLVMEATEQCLSSLIQNEDSPDSHISSRNVTSYGSPRLSPAQILKGPRSFAVLRGETITLRCQFIGSPKPSVSWIKGGKILTPDERIILEEEEAQAMLTIKGAMTDDSGKYVVVVENSGGSDCQFASVSVEGPPDPLAERPVVTDVTNHSLVLAWSGSPFDGGSVITGYAVEMCSLPELRWQRVSVARHSTSYVVRNLLPNRSYTFRVRAENVHGFSDPSPESEVVHIKDCEEETGSVEVSNSGDVVIESGNLFSEKYDFLEVVGKGRFGVVHKCKDKESGEIRAAKVIRCVKQKDKQKTREEVDIMNQLRHPKLLQLVAAYENPKDLILVMEYISGGELFERVIADDFVLLEKDCVLFLQQICEGVRYMHEKQIIHLDLKPENILCVSKTSHQIKLIDFGLARKYDPLESIRVLFGTPEFVAPEVISYEPVTSASDMWSVGVICYVLLSGLSPFMGDSDADTFVNITRAEYDFDDEAFDAVSADAKDFINQLFKKRPEKRLSASACLRHTWLVKDQNRMSVVQLCTDKLKKFIVRRKWQKTGNAIRALGRMVSLSSPSRSTSSLSSQSDSELSFSLQTHSPLICSSSITEKDEDTESGVFLSNDSSSIGETPA